MFVAPHSNHVCVVPTRTCGLHRAADMSACMHDVSHSRHVQGVAQLCHAAGISAVPHSMQLAVSNNSMSDAMSDVSRSTHACCVTQQTQLWSHTANMTVGWHNTHVCCDTTQTCLLCHEQSSLPCDAASHVRVLCHAYVTCPLCRPTSLYVVSCSRRA